MVLNADIALAVETARLAVEAGAAAALRHFSTGVAVETKSDRSPVTVADRAAEAAILGVVRKVFPSASILAEESGAIAGDAHERWIVDPLDGTRGFTRGGPFWGPLVGFEYGGEIVAGAMALPVLGETYWAGRGMGAFRNGEPLTVSTIATIPEATLSLGEMRFLLDGAHGPGIRALVASAASTRCLGDLAGCAMLLLGRADVWIERGVQAWDLAPLKVLVEEAGGRFSDFSGASTIGAGEAVASNGLLHDAIVSLLRG